MGTICLLEPPSHPLVRPDPVRPSPGWTNRTLVLAPVLRRLVLVAGVPLTVLSGRRGAEINMPAGTVVRHLPPLPSVSVVPLILPHYPFFGPGVFRHVSESDAVTTGSTVRGLPSRHRPKRRGLGDVGTLVYCTQCPAPTVRILPRREPESATSTLRLRRVLNVIELDFRAVQFLELCGRDLPPSTFRCVFFRINCR